jgi:hypothetical protein
MISNMNEKRRVVGRGMAKVANQKNAKLVPMKYSGSAEGSAPKAQVSKKGSVGSIDDTTPDGRSVMRGAGAATKGKMTSGLIGPKDISVKGDMKRRLPGD